MGRPCLPREPNMGRSKRRFLPSLNYKVVMDGEMLELECPACPWSESWWLSGIAESVKHNCPKLGEITWDAGSGNGVGKRVR